MLSLKVVIIKLMKSRFKTWNQIWCGKDADHGKNEKEMKNLKELFSGFILIVFFSFVIFSIILSIKEKNILDGRGNKYTTALISNTFFSPASGIKCNFYFYVDSKEYIGSSMLLEKEVGSCYLLKYEPKNPKNYQIYDNIKFKECDKNSLGISWDKTPVDVIEYLSD